MILDLVVSPSNFMPCANNSQLVLIEVSEVAQCFHSFLINHFHAVSRMFVRFLICVENSCKKNL